MSEWAMKRFWSETKVVARQNGFAVELDGRSVKTPAKAALTVPTQALAEAIAAEWDAQTDKVDPTKMPVTRAANATIDKVTVQFDEVAQMLADYGDSDLLCYRADAPSELVARQAAAWDPLLDWAAGQFGARLSPRSGVMHAPQDPAALEALRAEVMRLTAYELTAFHDLVSLSGSLVIGLAAVHDAQPVDALWGASRIDETWQEEQWGEDEEATRVAAIKRQSFLDAYRFLGLSRAP